MNDAQVWYEQLRKRCLTAYSVSEQNRWRAALFAAAHPVTDDLLPSVRRPTFMDGFLDGMREDAARVPMFL